MTIAMTPQLFKQLAVANLIVPFVGVAVDVVRSPAIPDVEPFTMSDGIQSAIALLFIVVFVATSIGFCLFARWSRPVALWFLAAAVAWTALDGPSQSAALAQAFYDLSSLLSGATLAAAYWSPVSRLFEPGKAEDDLREVFR
ncbi:hypothetical protein [Mesorhizobium sp. IMUNJ 23232]|uniref:hypothetical protein n=1 Tax=Mesorhizobium sp. IMUNJ 23232 TaxID=3376064 RepID=UPI00379FCE30